MLYLYFALAILLFATSVVVAPPWRFVMGGVALFIELVTPLFTLHIQAKLPRFSTSKLPERFGFFTIIVLGKTGAGALDDGDGGDGGARHGGRLRDVVDLFRLWGAVVAEAGPLVDPHVELGNTHKKFQGWSSPFQS